MRAGLQRMAQRVRRALAGVLAVALLVPTALVALGWVAVAALWWGRLRGPAGPAGGTAGTRATGEPAPVVRAPAPVIRMRPGTWVAGQGGETGTKH